MSNLDGSVDRIKEIAESFGYKHKKEHLVRHHEQMSVPYLRFLRSMARSAVLVLSVANNLSRRLNNLEKISTELSQNNLASLEPLLKDDSSENCLALSQSDCDSLVKLIENHTEMEKESQLALSAMFTTSVTSCFEVYIQDLVYEIFVHYPNTLRSSKTITYDEILKYSSMDTLISYMAQLEASKSTEGFANEYLARIAKRFGATSIDELINGGIVQDIDRIISIRNVIVHSGGIVDLAYLRRYPKSGFQEGDRIELSLQEVAGMSETIRLTTDIIEDSVTQKFCDIATIKWSEQADMYLEYVLDLENFAA